ncbi:MAG: DJ-1/PfpI family protein, partial [Acidovorax sp.]|uniref:DJ-1/PfpI family protein n=1 Tax=Acidovorax sp. TaxID=1872122 RepID=UPI00391A795D
MPPAIAASWRRLRAHAHVAAALRDAQKTGNYLSEVAKPYRVLKDAGFSIVFASPNGGRISLDPSSVEQEKGDGMCRDFLDDRDAARMMEDTQRLDDILRDLDSIDAVFYPGGHGCMFDVGQDQRAGALAAGVFERGGVVGAVCHGVVGL